MLSIGWRTCDDYPPVLVVTLIAAVPGPHEADFPFDMPVLEQNLPNLIPSPYM
jgi:hypothetical protein